jgi:uncharacterized protein
MNTVPSLGKVSPIIKPVSARCNIACDYCYYKNTHCNQAHGRRMPDEVLKRVIEEIIRLANAIGRAAEFTWHGGEPTLAGLEFYQRVVEMQHQAADPLNVTVENNIQTNGTLLNEKWVAFAKEHEFTFGISLDGPRWLHDVHRFTNNGQGTFDRVMRGIRLLQGNDLNFGVLAVVTQASIGHAAEIIDFMVENDIFQFDLSPCGELPGTLGEKHTIRPDDYADFMIDAFEHWLAYDDPKLEIRHLKQMIYGLLGAEPGLCSMSGNYCGAFPTITPNGDAFFCDNYEGSEDMYLGNITETPLDELLYRPNGRHMTIRREVWLAKQRCAGCEWFRACGGGCPRYSRGAINESFTHDNYFCPAYKRIISHIAGRIEPIMGRPIG